MQEKRPSLTAIGIAVIRAIESSRPKEERICDDPFARRFCGAFFYYFTKFFVDIGYTERSGPGAMGFLVARDRYIDETLASCVQDGLEQMVILGAGYDSRAYRFEPLLQGVAVFELDHAATQQDKVEKLHKILGALPGHVVFVPIDFNRETLAGRLLGSGYNPAAKTLFIWQGVTPYLTPEAVDSTLDFAAEHSGAGSSIVFDYIDPSLLRGEVEHGEIRRMHRYHRLMGEGLVFGIEVGTAEHFLEQRGFYKVKDVPSESLKDLYFTGANRNRQVASGYGIVSAVVKPRLGGTTAT